MKKLFQTYVLSFLTRLSLLLLPLYRWIIRIRNFAYDRHWLKSYRPSKTVISVGNLALGGTGKTPCVAYLAHCLHNHYNLAVVSRGYKRSTKGFRLATAQDDATTIGDEPYQLYRQLAAQQLNIPIAVDKNRIRAINQLLASYPQIDIILLDDGFQHRQVQRTLNLLLTSFHRPFFKDHLVPLGYLREPRSAAGRASAVLITKCPTDLTKEQQDYFQAKVAQYCKKNVPIFFAHTHYKPLVRISGSNSSPQPDDPILLLTGIADTTEITNHVQGKYNIVEHLAFPDHHLFSEKDITTILKVFNKISHEKKCILTTEKDSVRLLSPCWLQLLQEVPLFFLPITMAIHQQENEFVKFLLDRIKK
jgi:tetraacyldisaccharide 4'-kinase